MKTSKLKHDSYRVEINFGIGTQKEMTRWFTTKFIKNRKMEIPVKKNSKAEELIEVIGSTSGTSTYRILNKTTGFDQIVVIVNIDSRRNKLFIAKKDYKSLVKSIKTTFYHETRHAVDQIVKLRNLNYEDFENTAMLQAWINVEFEETLMDYITGGELEEIISESVKKRQEIKSYLFIFSSTINVPLKQDGKSPEWIYVFTANPDIIQTIYSNKNDQWEGTSSINSYKYDKNNTSNKVEVSWNGVSSSGYWNYDEHGKYIFVYTKVSGIAGQVILKQWESNKSLVIACQA